MSGRQEMIRIPASLILDAKGDVRRVLIYCYLYSSAGAFTRRQYVSLNMLSALCQGAQYDRMKRGLTYIQNVLEDCKRRGFISFLNPGGPKEAFEITLHDDSINQEDRYALVRYDEFLKIISADTSVERLTRASLMLLHAYLRLKIHRRSEYFRYPEAWNCYATQITEETGLPARHITAGLSQLESLELMIHRRASNIIDEAGVWHYGPLIIANAYPYDSEDITADEAYYTHEIEWKIRQVERARNEAAGEKEQHEVGQNAGLSEGVYTETDGHENHQYF